MRLLVFLLACLWVCIPLIAGNEDMDGEILGFMTPYQLLPMSMVSRGTHVSILAKERVSEAVLHWRRDYEVLKAAMVARAPSPSFSHKVLDHFRLVFARGEIPDREFASLEILHHWPLLMKHLRPQPTIEAIMAVEHRFHKGMILPPRAWPSPFNHPTEDVNQVGETIFEESPVYSAMVPWRPDLIRYWITKDLLSRPPLCSEVGPFGCYWQQIRSILQTREKALSASGALEGLTQLQEALHHLLYDLIPKPSMKPQYLHQWRREQVFRSAAVWNALMRIYGHTELHQFAIPLLSVFAMYRRIIPVTYIVATGMIDLDRII